MSEVFLSYRQTDDAQKQRVRAFGERLRDAGITVILDQFLLNEKPGGPDEGWDKWSHDRAINYGIRSELRGRQRPLGRPQ